MRAGRPATVTTPHADLSPGMPSAVSHEVHIWLAHLDADPGEVARRRAATTGVERDRASRFWRQVDGERYLSAHGALRLVLADYLACDPLALRFSVHDQGKPFLRDAELEFNLSHSGALALIAVARGRRVGVDVERVHAMPDLEALATRICTPDELATLAALAEPHRTHAFFALWTRKEALAKATGEGIAGVMRDSMADAEGQWTLMELHDLPGYAACVAAEGQGWQLVRRNVTASTGTGRR